MSTKLKGEGSKFIIRRGSVQTRVYAFKRKDGREVFSSTWHAEGRRFMRQFPTFAQAHADASFHADQLAAGRVDAASTVKIEDADTLTAARKLCGGVPFLAALQEWDKGRKLCGGSIIPACEAWKAKNAPSFKRIKLSDAIKSFIRQKNTAGKEGSRTYGSKLRPLTKHFTSDPWFDDITAKQLDACYAKIEDENTRNDYMKKAAGLWNWALKRQHLPSGVPLALSAVERAKGYDSKIGIINAATYAKLLEWTRANYPERLAAVVLAGFCGIRVDEIHGKHKDRSVRQTWEDVHLDRKFVQVSNAKENTAAYRIVPLCDAAIEWLMLCDNRNGPVCEERAMEKLHVIWKEKKFNLPKNCLRHSFISYRIAVTGSKPQVALEAGNSVTEIDKRYRVPIAPGGGAAWFAIQPAREVGEVIEMPA